MIYLLTYHWIWMLLAAFAGFSMGWIAVVQRNLGLSDEMMTKYAVFIAALILVSLLRLLPGRAGYWLDLALVMFVVYLVGCVAGSWLRRQVISRTTPAS